MTEPYRSQGHLRWWLTRVQPEWNQDGVRYEWPDFQFDREVVEVSKEPDPCRLVFIVHGLAPQPIRIVGPCVPLTDSPFIVRGIEAQLRWTADEVSLWLNGECVAQSAR